MADTPASNTVRARLSQARLPQRMSLRSREAVAGYLFIAPAVLGFLAFTAGPILASLYFSFTDYNILTWPPHWIGFDNYRAMVHDDLFWQSVQVTGKYALFALPLSMVFSLALAVLLNQGVKGITLWRTIYYLPSVVSGAAVAVLWLQILNPEFGIINLALSHIGINGPDWLGDPATALPALIGVSLWGIGGTIVIYLSGLQGIPTELYEAAEIDGAGAWRRFIHVTIPLLSPVIFFNLILSLIASFQWFNEPFIMTHGGPENSTLSYMMYLYNNALSYFKLGYAMALAWILFAVVMIITVILFRTSSSWVHYEGERRR